MFKHPVAGQPEFKTKDCHPQMKSGMAFIIVYIITNFVGMEILNVTPTG
jgi:hypothetical protein